MTISRLTLTDFRNHAQLDIAAAPGFVLLTGPNGAGKTNVLEAISMLSPGRGLRRAALPIMAREQGPGGFTVFAQLGDTALGVGTDPAAPDRKRVRINEANATASALAEWLSLMWLTPAMDRLFTEGASARRRFLDRLTYASQPDHARTSARYERSMRERNRLLTADEPADPRWYDALERQMADHGAAISLARQTLIGQLSERLEQEHDGPFARPLLALKGGGPATPDALLDAIRASRHMDRAAGRTLVGPHRADLLVRHAAKDIGAEFSSTGEQKAMLLAIVLAHADAVAEARGARPILLLDEVAAHLDPVRREALFARLDSRGGQVWMTGTEPAPFHPVLDRAVHVRLP